MVYYGPAGSIYWSARTTLWGPGIENQRHRHLLLSNGTYYCPKNALQTIITIRLDRSLIYGKSAAYSVRVAGKDAVR